MPRDQDPIELFRKLHEEARRGVPENVGDAVALATADAKGAPSARVILLRGVDERGFVFYTNLESRKGREITQRPAVALCFHWAHTGVQIRVTGRASQVSDAEADAYFAGRARASQIAAWASEQSRPLKSRTALLRRFVALRKKFGGRPVPRPPRWSGYRVAPDAVEIWFDRANRLHERRLYERDGEGWRATLLNP